MRFKVEVNNASLTAALSRFAKRMTDIRPALEAIGDEVIEATRDAFEAEASPFGGAWPALKRNRARNVRASKKGGAGGTKILRDTGALYNSINAKITANSVEVGTDRKYGPIHQWGGTINRQASGGSVRLKSTKRGTRFARKGEKKNVSRRSFVKGAYVINIPARPYLPIDRQGKIPTALSDRIKEVLYEHLAKV